MGDIEVVRWNGVDFLVPKHLRKSKIRLLEQISAKNPYVTFFLGHPVYVRMSALLTAAGQVMMSKAELHLILLSA